MSIPEPPGGDAGAKLFRDRVKRVTRVPAALLKVNPKNWREHPDYQSDSLTKVLERVGFVGAVLARELVPGDDTELELLDGHLRRELLGDQEVTVLVTDLSEDEAAEILATFDQITTLALPNQDKLRDLLGELRNRDVPLMQIGYPEFKLEHVFGNEWKPPPGSTADILAAAAAGGEPDAEPATTEDDPSAGDGYKSFTVPLTVAQDAEVRAAIKAVKARDGLESSGDALAVIVAEWTAAGKE